MIDNLDKPVRAAIIGLGWWGKVLYKSLASSNLIKVTHGVDPMLSSLSDLNSFSPEVTLSNDYQATLRNPDIDAIILATPHGVHEEQALAAISAGKHVFCEKPLALTSAGAARIVRASRAAGLVLGVGHERRFETSLKELANLATSGQIGNIVYIDCNWSHQGVSVLADDNWRKDPTQAPCGMFTGLGIHITDWILSALSPVAEVNARTTDGMGRNSASVAIQFTLQNGVEGHLCCLGTTPFYFRLTVFGTEGWAEIRQVENVDKAQKATMEICFQGKTERHVYHLNNAVLENLDSWGRAIIGTGVYPISDRQLIHNIEIMHAIIESSYKRQTTAVQIIES